jgi:hypothetical protein
MRGNWLARAQDLAAAGLFGLFLAAAVPVAVLRSAKLLSLPSRCHAESEAAARARFEGPDYVRAIDEIRRDLPEDEPYLLVEAGRPQDGGVYWVRFDLAPRRAVYLGQLAELTDAERLRRRLTGRQRQVVISYGPGLAPRLVERYRFAAEIERDAGSAAGAAPGTGASAGGGAASGLGTTPGPGAAPGNGAPPGTATAPGSHGR